MTFEPMILVSACLLGLSTRYDGSSAPEKRAMELLRQGKAIPVCPEQLAGLPTPRPKCTLKRGGGKDVVCGKASIITEDGRNITKILTQACSQIIQLGRMCGAKTASLKEASPSCGVRETNIDWQRRPGMGILAATLLEAGITPEGL